MKNTLKSLRAENNLTQEQLAKSLGITRATLNSIENSKSIPNGLIIIRIANLFGIPAEQIFFENDVKQEIQD